MAKNENLIAKTEAGYAKDAGDAPCSSCGNFIAPDSCKLVAGAISPEATCDLYTAPAQEPLIQDNPAGSPEDLMAQLFGGQNG